MSFTEFCCKSGGSNLNAGTRTGNSTEPGNSADFTYASGSWTQATGIFVVASGNPSSDGVAVGDFASVYADGSSITGFVGRVTAVTATSITVSLTAKSGTAPTDGTLNRTLKIGGAWAGPSGTSAFPLNFVEAVLTNSGGDSLRVNLKNTSTYAMTSGIAIAQSGPMKFEGYTTNYGDTGRITIDGGTTGASYVLLTVSGTNNDLENIILSNNGATGSNTIFSATGAETTVKRCVATGSRGHGFQSTGQNTFIECESYDCNKSNTANTAGFRVATSAHTFVRCISHDNTGSNAQGFRIEIVSTLIGCIADSNGADGFNSISTTNLSLINCDSYNNTGDGIDLAHASPAMVYMENCNFIKNGGWGINGSTAQNRNGMIVNCGFGTGTEANTSGTINGESGISVVGSVNYPSNTPPYSNAATGNFNIAIAQAKGAGRGSYTQTAPSYSGTVSNEDIGAAHHADSGGSAAYYVSSL